MVMTVASSWAVTVLHCPWCCITKNAHIVMKFSSSNFHKVDIHEWWYYWYLLGKSIVLYCAPPLHTYAHANSASTLAPLTSPTYLIWSVKVSCFWCRDVAEIASFCLQRGLLNSTPGRRTIFDRTAKCSVIGQNYVAMFYAALGQQFYFS